VRNAYTILIEKLKGLEHLGHPGIGERIILKCTLRKWDVGIWTGLSGLG
jgi:hypothetical protein